MSAVWLFWIGLMVGIAIGLAMTAVGLYVLNHRWDEGGGHAQVQSGGRNANPD